MSTHGALINHFFFSSFSLLPSSSMLPPTIHRSLVSITKHKPNKVLPHDLQHPCADECTEGQRRPTSLRHDSRLGASYIFLHSLQTYSTLSKSGRWKLIHPSPGGFPWWWAPRGAASQKRYHGCRLKRLRQPGPAIWRDGHHIPRSAGFMLPTSCGLWL